MNNKTFNGFMRDISRIRVRRLHTFGMLMVGYDMYGWNDFRKVINTLTDL